MLVARCFGVLSSTLWGAGALFAVLLALIVSGATIIVLMCLLMLADLTENRPKDAFARLLFHRQGMGMNSEFWSHSYPSPSAMPHDLRDGSKAD